MLVSALLLVGKPSSSVRAVALRPTPVMRVVKAFLKF